MHLTFAGFHIPRPGYFLQSSALFIQHQFIPGICHAERIAVNYIRDIRGIIQPFEIRKPAMALLVCLRAAGYRQGSLEGSTGREPESPVII